MVTNRMYFTITDKTMYIFFFRTTGNTHVFLPRTLTRRGVEKLFWAIFTVCYYARALHRKYIFEIE